MDAQGLINAMIANLVGKRADHVTVDWTAGSFDAIAHAVSIVREIDETEASKWLAEEIQERIAAQA